MGKKILVGCYEPGWGGASTGYIAIPKNAADGFDVAYVSLIAKKDKAFFSICTAMTLAVPRRSTIYTCMLEAPVTATCCTHDMIECLSPHLLVGRFHRVPADEVSSASLAACLYDGRVSSVQPIEAGG
jgi:hypothetical protein